MENITKRLDDFIDMLEKRILLNENKVTDDQRNTLLKILKDNTQKTINVNINKVAAYVHEILKICITYFYGKKFDSNVDFSTSIKQTSNKLDTKYNYFVLLYLENIKNTLKEDSKLTFREENLIFEQSLFVVDTISQLILFDMKIKKENTKVQQIQQNEILNFSKDLQKNYHKNI